MKEPLDLAFDDSHHAVPVTDFDYDAVDMQMSPIGDTSLSPSGDTAQDVSPMGDTAQDLSAMADIPDRAEVLRRTLSFLCEGKPDTESIGRRTVLLAHYLQLDSIPKSQRALGRRMGLSAARVNGLLRQFKRELRALQPIE